MHPSTHSAIWWLSFTLLFIFIQSFYSMMEMAAVSFNKVRLQYYYSKGDKRAVWLNWLLQNPSRLFGTTLLAVNFCLQVGSECSRELYSALNLDPDIAPLTQVVLVLIFAELAPLFAARRYAEHVAMLGIPILYSTAILLKPVLWILGIVTKFANFLAGGEESERNVYISRDELQKIIEEQDEDRPAIGEGDEFNIVVSNIFNLRGKNAKEIMDTIYNVPMVDSTYTVEQVRTFLDKESVSFIPVYHRHRDDIIGIALPRDLIRATDTRRVRDYTHTPWFITQDTPANQILKQFRSNNESLAVVLNEKGKAIGIITLDDFIEEIFGKLSVSAEKENRNKKKQVILERTFPGSTKISDFNKQYNLNIEVEGAETLGEMLTQLLGHHPEKGESIYIEPFDFIVNESSLLDAKSILVKTRRGIKS